MVSKLRVGGVLCSVALGLFGIVALGDEPSQSAEALVEQALVAEQAGDLPQRSKMLETAIALSPRYAPARWHAGMVRVDDEWRSVEAAEQQTAAQGVVFEYRQLRDRHAGTVAGQEALARWCRKNKWTDLEKMHWTNVLLANPSHRDARSGLGVREYGGMLLTKEEVDQYREGQKAHERALKDWSPRLTAFSKSIAGQDSSERERARAELYAIGDPEAIPAIRQALSDADQDWAVDLIRAIGNIKGQDAVDVLVDCAVNFPQQAVREAATEQLKQRSVFSYAPALLGALETPIELSYYLKTFGKSVYYGYEFDQEVSDGAQVRSWNFLNRLSMAAGNVTRRTITARELVTERNKQAEATNERVAAVLAAATGQQFGNDPKRWWQWWADSNQLHIAKQTKHERTLSMSCFLRGTQVWTDTGAVSIENVRAGDRVLSQSQETGELSYKLVLDTTIRPPSPSLRLGIGSEEIVTTLGHPMWVVGKGWRMAKELEPADFLHGVHGCVPIDYIQPGPEAEAYNLVVADFHNYFVGKQRVLVHDNQMRKATDATLPGFVSWKE